MRFTTPFCLALNDTATDIFDREIRNVSFSVEKCRSARATVYERVERKSVEYNVKARKETKKIVCPGHCKFFKVLNFYRRHKYPTSQRRSNRQRMWLSGKVRSPVGCPQDRVLTLCSTARAASKEKGHGSDMFKRRPTCAVRGTSFLVPRGAGTRRQ